jgi:hypothetical protein
MGRKREYTDEAMVKALTQTRGLVYLAADIVGCHYDTIYDRAKVSPAVASAMRRERGKIVDVAESKLFGYVEGGEAWAIQFALRNLGKDRGYVERQEVEQTTHARLVIEEDVVGDDNPPGETAPGAG